jgi:type III pantothenate kinase
MLWAIDIGNTQTVLGIHQDGEWKCNWRLSTNHSATEDELASQISALCELEGLDFSAEGVIVGSVVPGINEIWKRFSFKWLGVEASFLQSGEQVGIPVLYTPPNAVGADRIANALGALAKYDPPLIVVDFGTATTFDVVSKKGEYLGGAILPGVNVSMKALISQTAKLPQIELSAPPSAIGTTTTGALQSGIVLGHAAAVDTIAEKIMDELDEPALVIATGGLGVSFEKLCTIISKYDANLTLDGLRLAHAKMTSGGISPGV